jgi:peptide chain release factor 2
MGEPGFWDVQEEAKKVVDRLKALRATLEPWTPYAARLEDAGVLLEMGIEANDEATLSEAETLLADLLAEADRLETRALLSGPNDAAGAFLSVKAGAGGTESHDWAEMLLRMYVRWEKATRGRRGRSAGRRAGSHRHDQCGVASRSAG